MSRGLTSWGLIAAYAVRCRKFEWTRAAFWVDSSAHSSGMNRDPLPAHRVKLLVHLHTASCKEFRLMPSFAISRHYWQGKEEIPYRLIGQSHWNINYKDYNLSGNLVNRKFTVHVIAVYTAVQLKAR